MVPESAVLPREKDIPPDPMLGEKAKTGFISYWGRVLKASVFAVADVLKNGGKPEPLSKTVAKERKRSRVFAIEDLDSKVIDRPNSLRE